MNKRWVVGKKSEEEAIHSLSQSININTTLASILVNRGVTDFDEAKAFFRPELNHLHDPFLMLGMEKAVTRIEQAIEDREGILLYGDYDVDGTTSVSMFYSFLKNHCAHLSYYIPDRYKEGYGLSDQGVEWARENDFTLIITLDCGISANRLIDENPDLDFIICDHHKPGEKLPQAHAILNPKQKDCKYPYKELSGCGVAFKLIQAFSIRRNIEFEEIYSLLDFVVVSIAADIVPITGENRTLAFFGLKVLNEGARVGIKALIDVARAKGTLDISNIVFGLAPRINAAGRIAHAHDAVKLLIADEIEEAEQLAQDVQERNDQRKNFDEVTTLEAIEMIEQDEALKSAKTTVLYRNDWHKGVIGIVASRCIERYHRPTIIFTESNNKATGSARSVEGFDIYDAIASCSHLLSEFGGHKYAAGLTIDLDKIDDFQSHFESVVSARIKDEQLIPSLNIDEIIELDQITDKFVNVLGQMAPFGPGNMQPVFVSDNLFVEQSLRVLKGSHLKLKLGQDGCERKFEAIAFGQADHYSRLANGDAFSAAYTIEKNHYMGRTSLQLNIRDIRF
ncbi:MAG: single-stranded-DNA-specific exonuclease RecJ [Bacteroidota bacterium]